MDLLFQTETWISLVTLTLMETVLGIDNIVFIAILASKLPKALQPKARKLGLGLALLTRLGLLFTLSAILSLTQPFFSAFGHPFSGRDLILLAGGLFLIYKATHEIYEKIEIGEAHISKGAGKAAFGMILLQIAVLDIVFSLDSVITAVGMAKHLSIMVAAMLISVGIMLWFAGPLNDLVHRHPSLKILALSFLLLIGVMLTVEGMGQHVSKGYIYSAMAFSLLVEFLNMRLRAKSAKLKRA